jgi:hypothetical protein
MDHFQLCEQLFEIKMCRWLAGASPPLQMPHHELGPLPCSFERDMKGTRPIKTIYFSEINCGRKSYSYLFRKKSSAFSHKNVCHIPDLFEL